MKFEIRSFWNGSILFSLECESMKLCVEAAVKSDADLSGADLSGANLSDANLSVANLSDANLSDANLRDANLRDADLSGADLSGADLRGAVLSGADLSGAVLSGAVFDIKPATDEEAIANLDKVREIILDKEDRLNMGHWHGDNEWKNRTCAEETLCGTSHCLAGWLQTCSTRDGIKDLFPATAGYLEAPVAHKMFFRGDAEALEWLRDRKYVEELKEQA